MSLTRVLGSLLLALVACAAEPALAQLSNGQRAELGRSANLLGDVNPGFENGKWAWTASGAGTFAVTSTAANVGQGNWAASWQPTATGAAVISTQVTIPSGLYGKRCRSGFMFKGGDAGYTAEVVNATPSAVVAQTLATAATYRTVEMDFTCPSTGTLSFRLRSTTGSPALIYLDAVSISLAELRAELLAQDSTSANYVGFSAPALSASTVWTLPAADGTSGYALTTNGSGALSWASGASVIGTVAIANGGTGQTTKTAAMDALSPETTKGDLSAFNGSDVVRLGVGSNGAPLVASSGAVSGLAYQALALSSAAAVTGNLGTGNGGTGVSGSAVYPASGTVVTEAATETLTNKTLGSTNTLTGAVAANLTPDGSHTLTLPTVTDTLAAIAASQTLTNKTLTSPTINTATMAGTVVSDYLNLVEIATPANPAAGSVRVYSKSGDSLYTLNSAGTETQVGSGSGQKNYLQAGSNTATTWAASGAGVTVTTDTTAADLPRANTTKTGIKITSASGSGVFVASDFVLDTADYNTKLQVQFSQACGTAGGVTSTCVSNDFKVDVYSCTSAWTAAGTCAGTQTRLALSTDSSSVSALPALNGTYRTTFDAPGSSAANIEVRIGTNATHTHSIVLSDVVVGPGIVTQGAAGTSWSSYTPVVTGLGSGTTTTLTGVWRREFDSIHVRILHVESGTAGTGATSVKWSLPTFATINYGAMISTAGSGQDNIGSATTLGIVASSQADRQIQIFGASSTTVGLIKPLTSTSYQGSDIAANAQIYFDFTVPVNEWAGAGTVNVVQNDGTYYSCTGTTWGTSAGSCTTAIGPSGVQGGTTTPSGTSFTYSFTPTYPIPVGVSPQLEVSGDQTHWTKVGGNWTGAGNLGPLSYIPALTALCGASVHTAGGGQLVVSFGKYVDANSTPWSGTWYWRVSVGLPGQAVGFSSANATSSGLIDTQTQTFAGDKTFNGSITRAGEDAIYVFNAAGNNPLSSATLSPVVFATTFVDQTSAFSSNTYTCKHAGIYRVAFDGSLNKTSGTSTAADFWNINIRKNGAAINSAELQMSMGYTTGQDIPFHTEVLVSLAVNDTVTAAVVYNAGGARTWVGNADNVNLVITKI